MEKCDGLVIGKILSRIYMLLSSIMLATLSILTLLCVNMIVVFPYQVHVCALSCVVMFVIIIMEYRSVDEIERMVQV